MGRNRVRNTYEHVRQKIQQGYGRGKGLSYKPWFTGHEFASQGVYTRMMGLTIPRMYVFLSRLEADLFIYYDTDRDVTDILDQYYMDLKLTLKLSESMGIQHPWSDRYYHAMTADLVFQKDGVWHARSVKTSEELDNPRSIQKLRLEKAYFDELGIDWKIVTEREINRSKVQNLNWLYYTPQLEDLVASSSLRKKICLLFYQLYIVDSLPVPAVVDQVESLYNQPEGTGIAALKALIRNGDISVDLEKPLNLNDPLHPSDKEPAYARYLSYGKSGH